MAGLLSSCSAAEEPGAGNSCKLAAAAAATAADADAVDVTTTAIARIQGGILQDFAMNIITCCRVALRDGLHSPARNSKALHGSMCVKRNCMHLEV